MPDTCINLREHFGNRFVVRTEGGEIAELAGDADVWLQSIVCKYGRIAPHGGDKLLASTTFNGGISKSLRSVPGVDVLEEGDSGAKVAFPVAMLDAVAKILKPELKPATGRQGLAAFMRKH